MGLIQHYQITCKPVNQAICIFIIVPVVFCNHVSIKCYTVLLSSLKYAFNPCKFGDDCTILDEMLVNETFR